MDTEMLEVLRQFGVMGLWGIIIYKIIDTIEVLIILWVVGYGIKKAYPSFKELVDL